MYFLWLIQLLLPNQINHYYYNSTHYVINHRRPEVTKSKAGSLLRCMAESSDQRNVTVWCTSVCPSVPFFLTLIQRAAHAQRDSPGGSTRRGQRTFPSCKCMSALVLHSRAYGARLHLTPTALDPLRLRPASSAFPDGARFAPR